MMSRLAIVLNLLAVVMIGFALMMLVPLGVSLGLEDRAWLAHAEGIYFTALCGALLWMLTRRPRPDLQTRDGFLFVVLVWTVLPAFATVSLLAYLPGLSFSDAYFETMSGLTATGSTALLQLDALPASINLWRAQLQWLGGMGVIVLAVAILPLLGVGGRQILRAETPGPMKDQPAVELVAIAFMFAAGINFGTHFLVLRGVTLRHYRADPELRAFLAIVALSVALIAVFLFLTGVYTDFPTALRYSAFNVVSATTTTGYATADYSVWPIFAPLWMLLLCTLCTSSLSAGGGIKMMRVLLMVQQAYRELMRMVHPRAQFVVKLGGRVVENNVILAVLAYMLVYGATLTGITMLLAATGIDFLTAFSAATASLNNLGPGLGNVGPVTVFHWIQGALAFAVASADVDQGELRSLAQAVRRPSLRCKELLTFQSLEPLFSRGVADQ